MSRYEEASAALKKLRASMPWAYAFGHGCTLTDHPAFQKIRDEDARLMAIIKEHKP